MKSYKYILIDWDGCLAKTLDLWLETYKHLMKKRNIPLPADKVIVNKSFGLWAKGLKNLGIRDSEFAYKQAWEIIEEKYSEVQLYDGAVELLKQLKMKNKIIGLLTSSMRKIVGDALKFHKLDNYFDAFVARDDVEKGKPDPEQIDKMLEILKGTKEKSLIIGDSYHDIQAGKNAGIITVCFYPNDNKKFYTNEEIDKEKPDYIIYHLTELIDIVN